MLSNLKLKLQYVTPEELFIWTICVGVRAQLANIEESLRSKFDDDWMKNYELFWSDIFIYWIYVYILFDTTFIGKEYSSNLHHFIHIYRLFKHEWH